MSFDLNKFSNNELLSLIKQVSEREKIKIAYEDYASYLNYILPETVYKHSAHTLFMAKKLQEIAYGTKTHARLMINVPIRHGKSETAVKRYISYYLGRNPNDDVMVISFGAELAEDFSRIARQDFKEFGFQIFGKKISSQKTNVSRWEIDGHRGGCTACGIGGSIFGRGARLILLDDVFKDYKQAYSHTVRESVWNFYKNVLRGRLTPDGNIVIINVRWHPEDLCGKLLEEEKNGGEKWEVISLPALSLGEHIDPLGRKEGEPLWPERFNYETLMAIKSSVGSVVFETQYQQNPVPQKGYTFSKDYLQFFTDDEILFNPSDATYYFRGDPIIQTLAAIDPATKLAEHNDFTAIIVISVTRSKNVLIRKIFNKKISIPDQLKYIVSVNSICKPNKFFVEEIGYQSAIREVLLASGEYVPFVVVRRGGRGSESKSTRINLMSPMFESRKIFLHSDEK